MIILCHDSHANLVMSRESHCLSFKIVIFEAFIIPIIINVSNKREAATAEAKVEEGG